MDKRKMTKLENEMKRLFKQLLTKRGEVDNTVLRKLAALNSTLYRA